MRSCEESAEPGAHGPEDQIPHGGPDSAALLRLGLVFYAVLLGAAFLWRSVLYGESLLYAGPGGGALHPLRDGAVGVAAGLALVVASRVWTRHTRAGADLADSLSRLLGPLPLPTVAALALASGLAEEAFFRGALQPRVGLVAASLLFGLAHFVPRSGLGSWAPAAVLAGFVLGGLYEATGNLLAPVLAHVLVNALNLRWLAAGRRA